MILESACRLRDYVQKLDDALQNAPLTVLGSQGQERENPLLSEVRLQRASLAAHLKQLNLPELDAAYAVGNPRSVQARDAANARWQKRPA